MLRLWVHHSRCSLVSQTGWKQWQHLQQMGHTGQELGVDCQPAVETVSWLGNKAHSKLMLEHDDCCPEPRSM